MKKKITGMLLGLTTLCTSVLTGCGLIETDNNKLYNSVVSEIKDDSGKIVATVTSRELMNGYQSYGYYYEYNGMSRKEAVQETLKLLENREITILEAEKHFDTNSNGKNLSEVEKTFLWENVLSTLVDNLQYYYEEINGAEEEDTTTDQVKFEAYTKNAELVSDGKGGYTIALREKNDGMLDNYVPSVSSKDFNDTEDRELLYQNFLAEVTEDYVESLERYFRELKGSERGLKLSTDQKSVFAREMERVYLQSYGNLMIEKYTEHITEWGCFAGTECRVVAGAEKDYTSSVSVQDILDLYSSKVRTGYTKYVLEEGSTYGDDVSGGTQTYYYKSASKDTKYFSVANILFNKSTTESGKYDLIIREDDSTGVYEESSKTTVTKSEIENFISTKIQSVLASAQHSQDAAVVGDTIKDCVFKYNQDPGMLKADANYVIGVDSEGKAVSNFVEEFNNAGLELYNGGKGKVGDVVITESTYGIHVLVYTGVCENMFDGVDGNFVLQDNGDNGDDLSNIEILFNTRVSPMLDKTYFDVLFDELYVDNANNVQQANLDVLKSSYAITTFSGRIPESLKG